MKNPLIIKAALLLVCAFAITQMSSGTFARAQQNPDLNAATTLAQGLTSGDAEVRFNTIREMMKGRLFTSSAQLKEILADKDGNVRIQGMLALAGINDTNKFTFLGEALESNDVDARSLAMKALKENGEAAIPALVCALESKDSGVCIFAVKALEKVGWKPYTMRQKVLYLFVMQEWEALKQLGPPAVPMLIEMAGSQQWRYHQNVLFTTLGEMGDARALPLLVKSLKDGGSTSNAIEALNAFGAFKLGRAVGVFGAAVLLAIRAGYSLYCLVLRVKGIFRGSTAQGAKQKSKFRQLAGQAVSLDMLITVLIVTSAALPLICSNVVPAFTSNPYTATLFFPAIVSLAIFDAVRLSIWYARRHTPAGSAVPWQSGILKWLRAGTRLMLAGVLTLSVATGDFLLTMLGTPEADRLNIVQEARLSVPEFSEAQKQKFYALAASATEAVSNVKSVYLDEYQRKAAIASFVKIVSIRSPSRYEAEVRAYLGEQLSQLGARELECGAGKPGAPLNLVMELPATKGCEDRPALLLNAHMDTIPLGRCTPETMEFDAQSGDFYSANNGSFGADDKAGVALVLEAVRVALKNSLEKGTGHRRILVIFTAIEEEGLVGANYLALRYRHLFSDVDIALTFDGYLSKERPGKMPFVTQTFRGKEGDFKYKKIEGIIQDFAAQVGNPYFVWTNFDERRYYTDNLAFPPEAFRHMRSQPPIQGAHTSERMNAVDFIDHIDMLAHLVLSLDKDARQSQPGVRGER